MEHPDEGMIRALLDGEATGEKSDLDAHLAECKRCREMAGAQDRSWEGLTQALALLDVDPPVAKARNRIVGKAREQRASSGWVRRSLPKVASVAVLLTAGAAAALPGSPIRQWVQQRWQGVVPGEETLIPSGSSSIQEGREGAEGGALEQVGATIAASSAPLALEIVGLPADASIRVLLVEGDQAGIFAGEGTRFRTNSGVLVASEPLGEVTVEIPLAATGVSLSVNGEPYLEKTEGGLEVFGPVRTRTPTEIRFGPAGSEGG